MKVHTWSTDPPRRTSLHSSAAIWLLVALLGFTASPGFSSGEYTWTTIAGSKSPIDVAVDSSGNIYVLGFETHDVTRITPYGELSIVVSNLGFAPYGIAVSDDGTIYVACKDSIKSITPVGEIRILATFDLEPRFYASQGVAVDPSGTVYVADPVSDSVYRIPAGGSMEVLKTGMGQPNSLVADGEGSLFVACNDHAIRKLDPEGTLTVVAGIPTLGGLCDGVGSEARFRCPGGIALDKAGNLYVADYHNSRIRKITATGAVTTIGGLAANVPGTSGKAYEIGYFRHPEGIAVDAFGNVIVADTRHGTIKLGTPAGQTATPGALADSGGIRNLSVRGHVGEQDFMIPGFVVSSSGSTTVLIRAVGPGLERWGVEGVLADPLLVLYRNGNSAEPVLVNDDWSDTDPQVIASAASQVGAFPLEANSGDAAIRALLPPGAYTAVTRGADGGSGTVLVELYLID